MAVTQVADLAQDMRQQGFVPKVFSTNGVAYDQSFLKLAGSAANGMLTDQQSAMYLGQDAKTVPAVALFDKWFYKTNPGKHIDTYALYGWTNAQLFVQALRAAGPQPTRASLLTQLNKVTSFNANGLLATANPAQKRPELCWIMVKVANGNWQRTTPDPKSGFVCQPGGFHYPAGYTPFVRSN
jgi:ABC-type branched-subunit amino acid transport system substrate-binding protein